jgi:hypothetical protein
MEEALGVLDTNVLTACVPELDAAADNGAALMHLAEVYLHLPAVGVSKGAPLPDDEVPLVVGKACGQDLCDLPDMAVSEQDGSFVLAAQCPGVVW